VTDEVSRVAVHRPHMGLAPTGVRATADIGGRRRCQRRAAGHGSASLASQGRGRIVPCRWIRRPSGRHGRLPLAPRRVTGLRWRLGALDAGSSGPCHPLPSGRPGSAGDGVRVWL